MMTYFVVTFHTHLSALLTARALQAAGIPAKMMPVPRKLSSSCGTCVRYESAEPEQARLDADFEAVYRLEPDGGYVKIAENA